jgi:hypothetical protein
LTWSPRLTLASPSLVRYEVSVSLPIEYGTTTALDVISGLVFYKEYEKLVEDALTDFGLAEGMEADELGEMMQTAMRQDEGSNIAATKSVTMLVAAADYKKFCRMMRARSKEAPREIYF